MMDQPTTRWENMRPDEKARAVEAAIAEGAGSANEIAEALGVPSRNAIIGVCKRAKIDLPGVQCRRGVRGATAGRARQARQKPDSSSSASVPSSVSGPASGDVSDHMSGDASDGAIEPLDGVGVLFLDRTSRQCAALLDEAPIDQRRCCGAPVEKDDGPHVCAAHRARFYLRRSSARQMAGEDAA
ncbi:hypothetical protein [Afifella sp. YEN Y35]|uniref:hypothetical protein n=1 Tax=Afifella sp. YEN Y35 TaxID=3388337 RepID=UPI0039E1D2B8